MNDETDVSSARALLAVRSAWDCLGVASALQYPASARLQRPSQRRRLGCRPVREHEFAAHLAVDLSFVYAPNTSPMLTFSVAATRRMSIFVQRVLSRYQRRQRKVESATPLETSLKLNRSCPAASLGCCLCCRLCYHGT